MINLKEAWAIREDIFRDFVKQHHEAKASGTLPTSKAEGVARLETRGEVAIIEINGIITRRFDPFLAFFFGEGNGSNVEGIRAQLDEALEDDAVKAILLSIDSPGGELNGIPELAEAIFKARAKKPIIAHVSHQAASAGYWLASAANLIIAFESAAVGSIGVMFSFPEFKGDGTVDIVSSVSPKKLIDVSTEEGRELMQAHADKLGKIFIQTIARNRGVEFDSVIEDFGKGDIKIGDDALAAKMVDGLGSLEDAIAFAGDLQTSNQTEVKATGDKRNMKILAKIRKGGAMAKLVVVDDEEQDVEGDEVDEIDAAWVKEHLPEVAEELKEDGAQEENDRQEEVDEVAVEGDEEEEKKEEARRDMKATASGLALDLNKIRAKKTTETIEARKKDGEKVAAVKVDPTDPEQQDEALSIMAEAGRKAAEAK